MPKTSLRRSAPIGVRDLRHLDFEDVLDKFEASSRNSAEMNSQGVKALDGGALGYAPGSVTVDATSKTSSRIADPTPQAVRMRPAMKMRLARS